MPSVPQELADDLEGGLGEGGPENREPVDGYCLAKVIEVTEEEEKESGFAGQTVKFEVVEPSRHKGDWVWDYISYNPKAGWKWRHLFDATGYEYNSDTDELVEEEELVILECTPQMIPRGKNKGKMKTQVEDYHDPNDPEIKALID